MRAPPGTTTCSRSTASRSPGVVGSGALGKPPAYHSAVKPIVPVALLFEAVWLYLDGGFSAGLPAGFGRVESRGAGSAAGPARLRRRTPGRRARPSAVHRPGQVRRDDLIGGVILHDGAPVVVLSSTWSVPTPRAASRVGALTAPTR